MANQPDTDRALSAPASLLAWLRRGTENFFASQRILMDLLVRQNAHTVKAFQERMVEARNVATSAATEMAGEGISNFIAGQRVLLNLAQRENEILTEAVRDRVGAWVPAGAATDLFSRSVDTLIDMQRHFLTIAARQMDEWMDAAKSGEPFGSIHLTALARESMETFVRGQKKFLDVLAEETANATNGKSVSASKKTELTELARQSAEAYIDAQKKLLDVATQQVKSSAKTAREAVSAMNPLPADTLGELVKNAAESFVESEQAFLELMGKTPRHAAKPHTEPERPKPHRKRTARAKAKSASVSA